MGATALTFVDGSQFNTVSHNEFTDISATAVQIGGVIDEDKACNLLQ